MCALLHARLAARDIQMHAVNHSEEALAFLQNESVSAALISTEMERLGGMPFIEKIRKLPNFLSVPILMMARKHEVSQLLLSHERGFDDFFIKPFDPFELELRIHLNIARMRQRMEANALTHLPGNAAIERVIREKIQQNKKFSVLYLDINNFKSFNDRYGFEKGDEVIRQTSKVLLWTSEKICRGEECFCRAYRWR